MTDNEIIKALECCSSRKNCEENCPYFELKENFFECVLVSTSDAIDLIRRQKEKIDSLEKIQQSNSSTYYKLQCYSTELQAKIDRLKEISTKRFNEFATEYDNAIKAEAIKAFAARLQENVTFHIDDCGEFVSYVDCRDIRNLVKEMAGAGNGED